MIKPHNSYYFKTQSFEILFLCFFNLHFDQKYIMQFNVMLSILLLYILDGRDY